jgi:hypothetical protein
MSAPEREYLTRRDLVQFLREHGYPISIYTLEKLITAGEGPPRAGYWGNRPVFKPDQSLGWARGRVRPRKSADEAA